MKTKKSITLTKDTLFFGTTVIAMLLMILVGMNSNLWTQNENGQNQTNFVSGRVIDIIEDQTGINEAGARVGTQDLLVELLEGTWRGEQIIVMNRLFPIEQAVYAQVNQRVLVFLQVGHSGTLDGYFAHIQSYDREFPIYFTVALFLLLLIVIFGKSGVRAAFGLTFTFVTLIFALLPLIAAGHSPGFMTILAAILIIVVSIISIMGFKKKTTVSILGSFIGVGCYILFYFITGFILRIDGFNVAQIDLLIVAGFYIGVRELLFSSILIASLGGIMDVSVSLSSAVFELSQADKLTDVKKLFITGMKVSKDIVGSSANTLILAFTGTFLISLLLFATTNTHYQLLISRTDIAIEVLRAISASAAMIVCAPATVLIGATIFTKGGRTS